MIVKLLLRQFFEYQIRLNLEQSSIKEEKELKGGSTFFYLIFLTYVTNIRMKLRKQKYLKCKKQFNMSEHTKLHNHFNFAVFLYRNVKYMCTKLMPYAHTKAIASCRTSKRYQSRF